MKVSSFQFLVSSSMDEPLLEQKTRNQKPETRNRIKWRCRRGMLELDLILQKFLERYFDVLTTEQLKTFEKLLQLTDNDLWDLIRNEADVKRGQFGDVLKLLDCAWDKDKRTR